MIGKQVGHYRILRELGRGGMATVYLAEQVGLGRHVALKMLHPSLATDEVIVQRFLREARIAANLHHPHIVTIYDVGEAEGVYYIAMRYIDGEHLGHLIRREGPITPTRAVALLAQVADALDFAHGHRVLHRDVKPANVMVEPGDLLTLTDFGIARAGERSHLTAAHMVIGTPEYMAPEQARGEEVDERSDLYSLGVLFYEMLGGRPPFSGASTPSLLYMHVHQTPPPLDDLRPDLPRELCAVVTKALSKRPDDRYRSAGEMVAAARAALGASRAVRAEPVTVGGAAATLGAVTPVPPMPVPPLLVPSAAPAVNGTTMGAEPARARTQPVHTPPAPTAAYRADAVAGPEPVDDRAARDVERRRARARLLGPAIVSVALIAVTLVVLSQTSPLGQATPTPTIVAARPTLSPSLEPTTGPTAAPRPTEPPPTAAPRPTEPPPTAAPKPTAPPPTPGPADRVATAQSAMAAGDFPGAIAQLDAIRQDPAVQADPALVATVDETLRKTHVAYGRQLLERGQLDESYAQFGAALKIAPNDPDALDGRKQVILTKNYRIMEATWGKDDDTAIQALEENMILDPAFRETRPKLYALLITKADRLLGAGDRDGAFPVLTRALQVMPDRPEAMQRLATYTPTPTPPPPPPSRPSGPFIPPGSPV